MIPLMRQTLALAFGARALPPLLNGLTSRRFLQIRNTIIGTKKLTGMSGVILALFLCFVLFEFFVVNLSWPSFWTTSNFLHV